MSLNDEERKIMVEFEIEKAHRLIDQFPILENAKLWDTLANRVYYAVFHAVTALLIKNGLHGNRIRAFLCFSASILSRKA